MSTEHIKRPPSFTSGRRFGISLSVLISIVALAAIVVMGNFLGTRHYVRKHLASDHPFQLSPLTVQVAAGLTNRMDVVVMFDSGPDSTETSIALYNYTTALLREYEAVSTNVVVRSIDYIRDPGNAELIRKKYGLSMAQNKDFVLFDYNGRMEIVGQEELSEYGTVGFDSENRPAFRRKAFKGEQMFTSAMLTLSETGRQKVCYLIGHGEHDITSPDSQNGYAEFGQLLRLNNLDVEVITLDEDDRIPEDCRLLIVAGPSVQLHPSEADEIAEFLNRGGRMLCLLRSGTRNGLDGVLADWGIATSDDHVAIDEQNSMQGLVDLAVVNFVDHPVVRPLHSERLYLFLPRPVYVHPEFSPGPDRPEVAPLFTTGTNGVMGVIKNGEFTFSDADPRGRVPLAVASHKGGVPGVSSSYGASRVIVVGDSRFLVNAGIEHFYNHEFANLAVNWLLDRSALVDIGPKPVKYYRLSMTAENRERTMWLLLAGIPGSVLALGILVWLVRRK